MLTQRLRRLVERRVQPERILLPTITRCTVEEMIERGAQIHRETSGVDSTTFNTIELCLLSMSTVTSAFHAAQQFSTLTRRRPLSVPQSRNSTSAKVKT